MLHMFESGVLTVYLSGHIDTSNAPQTEKDVFALVQQYAPAQVILDMEELDYISSSGLRIILKLRQRFYGLKLINASTEVYEILDMTGFTEMMTVEKAFRRFDITGCQMIGKGANGKVYRYDRDTIVKVYNPNADLDEIKRERELSRTAFVLGVPTAIPYDVVKVGDCYGSVFELLNAKSFDEMMIDDPTNLEFVVKKTVEIAKILHSTEAPEHLPHQQDITLSWLDIVEPYLEAADFAKLKKLIEELPEKRTMLHGDLHIKNIMQLDDQESLLIDMDTLCHGHPIFELASIYNAYQGFGLVDPDELRAFLGISFETGRILWRRSLELYLDTREESVVNEVEAKAKVIGLTRLMRRAIRRSGDDPEKNRKMAEACGAELRELVPKLDTLVF